MSRDVWCDAQEETNKKIAKCEVGAVMKGTVETLKDYGAFVELENGLTGLLHISQISTKRIKHPGAVLKEGQEVRVKIISVADNRISLSMKELIEEEAEREAEDTYGYKEDGQASTGLADLLKGLKLLSGTCEGMVAWTERSRLQRKGASS